MLLGTDIQAVLTTLSALDVAGHRAQLLDRARGHARRDPLPRRDLARCPSTASPTPACPCRGPTARRSSPSSPSRWPNALAEFVERYGVGIVGGCCGTTPDHIAAIAERVKGRPAGERPAPGPVQVSSMMTATPLAQEPRPTLVGERVELAGLAQGQGAAAGRRLRRPRAGGRGPGRGRRPRARRVRGADRARRRGRADARGRQARLADPAGADPGRLDRARGDRGRAGADPRAARSSTRSTSRPAATSSTASCRWPAPTARR